MNVMEYLEASESTYEVRSHRPVFTAQQMAQEEHIHGMNVAKPVIVKADGLYYMCVLPACCKIDFDVSMVCPRSWTNVSTKMNLSSSRTEAMTRRLSSSYPST